MGSLSVEPGTGLVLNSLIGNHMFTTQKSSVQGRVYRDFLEKVHTSFPEDPEDNCGTELCNMFLMFLNLPDI